MTQHDPPRSVSAPAQPATSHASSVLDPNTQPLRLDAALRTVVPQRAAGVSTLGEYEGGGYDEPRYLVARGDGQMVLVSRMLNAVVAAVGDDRTLEQIAKESSQNYGAELSPEAVHYLIQRKLAPLGLVTLSQRGAAAPARANPLLALALHRVLLPERVVRRLAAIFAPLFNPVLVIAVALAVAALDVWLLATGHASTSIHSSVGSPGLMLAVLGVLLANTLFHEFGHAAGCRYGGGRPGAIGVGVLIVVPAFYTNVNDAYRLGRRARLRTDLGGIYFNAVFAVFLGVVYLWTGFAALPTVIVLIHLQMLQQLVPLVRLDGYYILGDLVGVPNLFEQIPPVLRHIVLRRPPERSITNLRPRTRTIITVWVALVVPALLAALVNMAIYLPSYARTAIANITQYWHIASIAYDLRDAGTVALALVSIVVLLVPWAGLASLASRTVAKLVRLVARHRKVRADRAGHGRHAAATQPELAECHAQHTE